MVNILSVNQSQMFADRSTRCARLQTHQQKVMSSNTITCCYATFQHILGQVSIGWSVVRASQKHNAYDNTKKYKRDVAKIKATHEITRKYTYVLC